MSEFLIYISVAAILSIATFFAARFGVRRARKAYQKHAPVRENQMERFKLAASGAKLPPRKEFDVKRSWPVRVIMVTPWVVFTAISGAAFLLYLAQVFVFVFAAFGGLE